MAKSEYRIVTNDKSNWNDLSGQLSGLCIFFTGNWLNCVSASWSVNTIYDCKDQICGAVVYHLSDKYGIKKIMNPQLTPYHGLWVNEEVYKTHKDKANKYRKIIELLNDSLQDFAYINFRLLPSISDVQHFKWNGYDAMVRYTYRLSGETDLNQLWSSLHFKTRNSITKAAKDLIFEETDNVEQHFFTVTDSFRRAKVKHPVSLETYTAIYNHLYRSGNSIMFCAKDRKGRIQASLLMVWDGVAAYMISHGTVLDVHRGATSLLIWKAIEFAIGKNLVFDFEGSDIQRISSFYRDFGGVLTPYYQVIKIKNPILRTLVFALKKL